MKLIKLFSLMLFCQMAFSQSLITTAGNEPFIEVKVSDTLTVSPDYLKILVEIKKKEEAYDDWNYDYDYGDTSLGRGKKESTKTETVTELPDTKAEIQKVLDKHKLTYVFHEEKGSGGMFSMDKGLYSNAFEVTLSNLALKGNLKAEIEAIPDAKFDIISAEVKNKHPYELKLIEKLMVKAKAEAEVIAKTMGVTLDKPLNVTNQSWSDIYSSMFNNPQSMGGMGSLFSMMGNLFKSPEQVTKVVIDKSLVVRFGYK